MAEHRDIRALLFDLGGVVIDIDIARMLEAWQPFTRLTVDQMRDRLAIDEPFMQHERGQMDAARYFNHLRHVLELEGDDEAVACGWNALLVDEIPDTLHLIEKAGCALPCYAFSNTSATHEAEWSVRFPRVMGAFERLFLSFEMGLRKPELAAFQAVARSVELPPESILFFDDLLENVLGARKAGLSAVHVRSPADVREALFAIGVLQGD